MSEWFVGFKKEWNWSSAGKRESSDSSNDSGEEFSEMTERAREAGEIIHIRQQQPF
jgi:hypothetical protein